MMFFSCAAIEKVVLLSSVILKLKRIRFLLVSCLFLISSCFFFRIISLTSLFHFTVLLMTDPFHVQMRPYEHVCCFQSKANFLLLYTLNFEFLVSSAPVALRVMTLSLKEFSFGFLKKKNERL